MEIAIETCVYVLIGLTAVSGNLLVIISVYRNRSLRNSTNYLALSLAITDILSPLTILPLSVYWLIDIKTPHFTYGQAICDFQAIWFFSLVNASGYTITLMAYNRFICVCKTDKYKQIFTKKKTLCMIVGLWTLCFVIAILLVKGEMSFAKFNPAITMCALSQKRKSDFNKIAGNSLIALDIIVPYSFTVYCYGKILKKIHHHKRSVAQAPSNINALGAKDIKITWTLFAVLLGYIALWSPVAVTAIVLSHNKGLPHLISSIIPMAAATSSAINPVIYALMSPEFRKAYIKTLKCR